MAGSNIKVTGLNKVTRNLTKLGVEATELKAAMRQGSETLANSLQRETPHKTGRIASTIRSGNAKGKASATIGRNSMVLRYAPVLNYAKNSKYPLFASRAAQKVKFTALKQIAANLDQIIRKHGLN